ncbi:zinc-ribbon domain-containing protein [Sediminicola sp. 1XM1-17]|uniref:zinc-ribbon domain-containing protein n=1 Tax=Sediminicola sp. 1XM1-17 TaxID=3127702 RepID=UPI0030783B85
MILFLGTKSGKEETKLLAGISCPYCKQTNTLSAITSPTYFHLFWISLFKVSTNHFVECSHCKRAYYKNEFTPEMRQALGID